MDVRFKLDPTGSTGQPVQEIVTGLPDGSLKSLFRTLMNRHPELQERIQGDELDLSLMNVLINNRPLRDSHLSAYHLKDGDTVSVSLRSHEI